MSNRHARKPRRPFGLKLRLHGPNEGEILDLAASTGERSLHRLDSVPRHVRSDLGCPPEWRGMCSGGVSLTRAVVDTSMERVLLCVVHETFPRRLHGHQAVAGFFDASRRPSSPGRRSFPVGSARVQPVAVAKRYARALADYVEAEPGQSGRPGRKDPAGLEAAASELALVVRIMGADPKFGRFFADPSIEQKNKQAAIE